MIISRSARASVLLCVLCTATAIGCAQPTPEPGVRADAIAIPGPWDPPAGTRSIARTQYVDVVDPPRVSPLGSCTSTNPFACSCTHPACSPALPGTAELDRYLRTRFPYLRSGGLYCCRQNSSSGSVSLSVHAIGRAMDLMVPMIGGDADNTRGDAVANFLVENAEYIGIQRVVWDRTYWNGERGFGALGSASLPHTDHIHAELSIDGAARRTPFFTAGAPPEVCPVVCYGTAVVATDCSFVDCALTGQVCLPDPPRCGAPIPPEPAEAARNAAAVLPTVAATGGLTRLALVPPQRLFDTRTAGSSASLVRSDGATSGPLTATRTGTFSAWSLPAGSTGAWLTLAAIPAAPGFVVAFPAGSPNPGTSTVNAAPPRVRANAAPVVLGAGGGVTFTSIAEVDLIADLTAAFAPSGQGLVPAGPQRVLDTRAVGMTLTAGMPYAIDARAPAGATGVVATLAVIGGALPGFVSTFPCAAGVPVTSSVNFAAGRVSSNTIVSGLTDGQLCVQSSAEAHLIVDVSGYLVPDGGLSYQALTPRRLLDTRSAESLYTGRLGERQVIELPIQALPGMPAGVGAVVANITATTPSGAGFVTAFPCGMPVPATSSLNYDTDGAVGGVTVMAVGGGSLCVFAQARTDLIVDVLGVWVPTPAAPPVDPGPGPDPHPDDPDDPFLPDGGVDPDADGGIDPGVDGGAAIDGGVAPRRDAGAPDDGALMGSCACRAARGSGAPVGWLPLAMIALFVARRRRPRR